MNRLERVESTYLWGIKILIFLIPFLPLLITPSMVFPYITGKNFAFRIIIELATALWISLLARNIEFRPKNSLITISVLLFTFIVGLSDIFGVGPYNSFWSNYERMEGYVTILHLTLYFLIVKSIFKTGKDWKILFSIFIFVSLFICLFAFYSPVLATALTKARYAMEYGERMKSTIGNPPFLASYLLLTFFLGIILFVSVQKFIYKTGCLIVILLNVAVIYLTASRGAVLATLVGIILLSLYYFFYRSGNTQKKLVRKFVIVLSVLLLIISVAAINTDYVKQDLTLSRFANMFTDYSVKSRLNAWNMAWEGFKERPILGWGQENFISIYTVNPLPLDLNQPQIWLDRAHNIIIHWLVNAGLFGLIAYILIFIAAFYILFNVYYQKITARHEIIILFTALIVYFIQNLFTFDTINTYIIFFSLLAYVDYLGSPYGDPDMVENNGLIVKNNNIKSVGATLLSLVVMFSVVYYVNIKPIRQNQVSAESTKNSSYSALLNDYNNALSYKTFGDGSIRERMLSISSSILRLNAIDDRNAVEFVKKTAEELYKGLSIHHHNLKYLTDLIMFFNTLAVHNDSYIAYSEALINECLRLNPNYEWLYMVQADTYILKKEFNKAFINVKKIAENDPSSDLKQLKLAYSAIYASEEDMLVEALDNVTRIRKGKDTNLAFGKKSMLSLSELYQFAVIYEDLTRYDRSLYYYEAILKQISDTTKLTYGEDFRFYDPSGKARIHFEIAEIYLALKDKGNARKSLEKAIELDPENFTAKSKVIINQLNN